MIGSTTRVRNEPGSVTLRNPSVRFPLWAVLLRLTVHGLVMVLVRLVTRPILALAVVDTAGLLVIARLGGPVPTIIGLLAVAVLLVGWRYSARSTFDRWLWWPVRAALRHVFVYRRLWQPAMVTTGLAIRFDRRIFVPELRGVASAGDVDVVRLRMLPGQVRDDYTEQAPRLARTFGALDCRVRPTKRGDEVVLWLLRTDRLAHPITPSQTRQRCDLEALPVAVREDGVWHPIRLLGTHVLIAGATGAGKSGAAWALIWAMRHALGQGLVSLWGLDPKGGMEFGPGRALFDRFCAGEAVEGGGPYEAGFADLLDDAVQVMRQRQAVLSANEQRLHSPTVEEPLLVVLVDELASLTAYVTDRTAKTRIAAALKLLLSQGRAAGVVVVALMQDPGKDVIPFRGLFPTRICLRVAENIEADMVLGAGSHARGALCEDIPVSTPGVGYVALDGAADPIRVRFPHITDNHIHHLLHQATLRDADRGRRDEDDHERSMTTVDLLTTEDLQDIAASYGICCRPIVNKVTDTTTGRTELVVIPCGATQARVCPACADKARRLRIQQCREGWHRTDEPETDAEGEGVDLDIDDEGTGLDEQGDEQGAPPRRVRSTRRREDVPDLPRVRMSDRTVGRTYTTPDGKVFRPSMFLTLTLPSYGRVQKDGTPVDPDSYDYHRAALDALHFPRLVDRFWQNLRRCAGYHVQYFACVEAQRRLAPHLHAAVRGVVPRRVVKQVAAATYHQLWWPQVNQPVYTDAEHVPVWDERVESYVDPETGVLLPTWEEAIDELDDDPDPRPAHVLRLGRQIDYQGIIVEAEHQVGRAVGYLTKYLTKDIADTYGDPDHFTPAQARHFDRLHAHVRLLPCSADCTNWLRYGMQPRHAKAGMSPGGCPAKAHDRWHLGIGGRRVLVSRQWTGKTLTEHRADRAEVVRQTLEAAGITALDQDRYSTSWTEDGSARFVWTPLDPVRDPAPDYRLLIASSIREHLRWRAEYQQAKQHAPPSASIRLLASVGIDERQGDNDHG
jgi:hypothetical protein